MVDANQGWRVHGFGPYPEWDLERATAFATAVEPFDLTWLEEPLDQHAYAEYAELRDAHAASRSPPARCSRTTRASRS